MNLRRLRYARFAWGVLGFNLFVILWGAFVRATGSGAGCGSHWPLCNGEVVPRAPALATLIELGHRATSGIALLLVVGLVVGAWRVFPKGHAVRVAATLSGFFILSEALIGAGLVLFEMVAANASIARGFWVAGHLLNTFLLVGTLTLTAWWAAREPARLRLDGPLALALGLAVAGMLLLGVSGAITALGDTLFPSSSLSEAKALTFSDTAHVFVRLRIWHPTLAICVFLLLAFASWRSVTARPNAVTQRLGLGVLGVYLVQLVVGAVNVGLLAPVAIQLVHLLLSDVIWIALILLGASAAEGQVEEAGEGQTARVVEKSRPLEVELPT